MAEKKMTRKEALENVLNWIDAGFIPSDEETVEEVAEVLGKMHAQVSKPRKKSDAPTKTQIINANLADKCVAAMKNHEGGVTSKWLIEHVAGLITPQKTTAVMNVAIADGRVTKTKEGKAVIYSLAE